MAQNEVGRFVVNDGSFFAGWNTGDEIIVYFNDSTKKLEVEQNGSPITSGPPIYGSYVRSGYITTSSTNYSFCDSADLIYWSLPNKTLYEEDFPYFKPKRIKDSPECQAVLCDIRLVGAPVITNATSGSSDGSIQITIYSSRVVKFGLGTELDSPDYNSMASADAVVSNNYNYTFSNLSAGTFYVYAKDSVNCTKKILVTVPVDDFAGYGEKYNFSYSDMNGNNRTIRIKKKAYTGGATAINYLDDVTLSVQYGSVNTASKINNILGSGCDLRLINETRNEWLDEFKVIYEKEYLIEIYENSSLLHRFFSITSISNEPRQKTPYVTVLKGNDGLQDLADIDYTTTEFTDEEGWSNSKLTGNASIIEIIAFCLKKTGLDQSIRVAMNVFADGHDSASGSDGGNETGDATDDPLAQTYLQNSSFYNDDSPKSCLDVIDSILKSLPEPLRISSYGGYWYITPIELTSSTVAYREFTKDGVYSSNSTIAPLIDIKSENESTRVVLDYGGDYTFDDVYRRIQVIADRNIKETLIDSFNFSTVTDDGFLGWESFKATSQDFGTWYIDEQDDKYYWRSNIVNSGGANNSYIQPETFSISNSSTDKLRLEVGYKINTTDFNPPYVRIGWILRVGTDYLKTDGTWTSTETKNYYFAKEYDKDSNFIVQATMQSPISTDNVELKLYSLGAIDYDFNQTSWNNLVTYIESIDIDSPTLPVGYKIIGAVNGISQFYYTLQDGSLSTNRPNVIETTASSRTASEYKWVLEGAISNQLPKVATIGYDYVNFTTLPGGQVPNKESKVEYVIDKTNPKLLKYTAEFITIEETFNNAEKLIQNGFLDSSGNRIAGWGSNSETSQDLISKNLVRFYKLPTRVLNCSGFSDVNIKPWSVIRDTDDDNRLYGFNRLTLNYKKNSFSCELAEIGSDTAVNLRAYSSGFAVGFK